MLRKNLTYFCPSCGGGAIQCQPLDGSPFNTIRVNHQPNCIIWEYIQKRLPNLVSMMRESVESKYGH